MKTNSRLAADIEYMVARGALILAFVVAMIRFIVAF